MSDGKTHRRVNILTGFVLVGGSILINMPLDVTVANLAGCAAGTWITPDYDLNAALPASFLTKVPGLRILWGTIWRPYQLLIKHRSFWSHFPFVGTSGRILYLSFWIFGIMWITWQLGFDTDPARVVSLILENQAFFFAMYLAWCAQDITHFILDV